jgi:hypothetical protein
MAKQRHPANELQKSPRTEVDQKHDLALAMYRHENVNRYYSCCPFEFLLAERTRYVSWMDWPTGVS